MKSNNLKEVTISMKNQINLPFLLSWLCFKIKHNNSDELWSLYSTPIIKNKKIYYVILDPYSIKQDKESKDLKFSLYYEKGLSEKEIEVAINKIKKALNLTNKNELVLNRINDLVNKLDNINSDLAIKWKNFLKMCINIYSDKYPDNKESELNRCKFPSPDLVGTIIWYAGAQNSTVKKEQVQYANFFKNLNLYNSFKNKKNKTVYYPLIISLDIISKEKKLDYNITNNNIIFNNWYEIFNEIEKLYKKYSKPGLKKYIDKLKRIKDKQKSEKREKEIEKDYPCLSKVFKSFGNNINRFFAFISLLNIIIKNDEKKIEDLFDNNFKFDGDDYSDLYGVGPKIKECIRQQGLLRKDVFLDKINETRINSLPFELGWGNDEFRDLFNDYNLKEYMTYVETFIWYLQGFHSLDLLYEIFNTAE